MRMPTTPTRNPKEHCDICRWNDTCDKRRRNDDHLCLVAGISKVQINELRSQGTPTTKALSTLPMPLPWKPRRGSPHSYKRIREQARVQVEARESGRAEIRTAPVVDGFGLCALPAPSNGDVFFDLEGDPFVGEHGLEYLFGYNLRRRTAGPSHVATGRSTGKAKAHVREVRRFRNRAPQAYPDLTSTISRHTSRPPQSG